MILINKTSSKTIVKAWQEFLKGQDVFNSAEDGLWGPYTENATKLFQSNTHLTADGLIGPGTIKAAESFGFVLLKPEEFTVPGSINAIFDISHLNSGPKGSRHIDFEKAKADGMLAVFHKATQSTTFRDQTYAERHVKANEAGLLWGAYHFGAAGNGIDQANFFLEHAKPDNDTLLVLDFEEDTTIGQSTMSLEEARDFVQQIKMKTGKYPGIYGGALLKQTLSRAADPILSKCWLWLAEYGPVVKLPNGWNDYTFWQFTDGTIGPGALPVDGIGVCDRDLFHGDKNELLNFWNTNKV